MAARFKPGTNDADGNGEKGGSLPDKKPDPERIDLLIEAMKLNGWTLPKGLE